MSKLKLTPFARLILFLVIFIPAGYFGYQYATTGKLLSASDSIPKTKIANKSKERTDCEELLLLKDREIEVLKNRIAEIERKN